MPGAQRDGKTVEFPSHSPSRRRGLPRPREEPGQEMGKDYGALPSSSQAGPCELTSGSGSRIIWRQVGRLQDLKTEITSARRCWAAHYTRLQWWEFGT